MKAYFKNVWLGLVTIMASMKVTARHLFLPAVTLQYPFQKREDLPGWQGSADKVFTRHRLEVDIDDCIGCLQCERACPVECIRIETIKTLPGEDLGKASTGHPKRLWVARFEIDMEKCCYCGLCIYPCPTRCIHMTDEYEYSVYNKTEHVYQFGLMTEEEAAAKRAELAEAMKEEKEEKARKAAEEGKAGPATGGKAAGGPGEEKRARNGGPGQVSGERDKGKGTGDEGKEQDEK